MNFLDRLTTNPSLALSFVVMQSFMHTNTLFSLHPSLIRLDRVGCPFFHFRSSESCLPFLRFVICPSGIYLFDVAIQRVSAQVRRHSHPFLCPCAHRRVIEFSAMRLNRALSPNLKLAVRSPTLIAG